MTIQNKKILVTGGAGFIGSILCEHLVGLGYYVRCLDNFSTGHIRNIQNLIDNFPNQFELVEGDIRNFETCIRATKGIDVILHEAALGSITRSINDPITTNDVNVNGFLNMLVSARDSGVKRFIFATSSSVYGDSAILPKSEDTIGHPLSPYALTKYVDELYAEVFAKLYGIEYIGLRYFNVFGRNQDPNSVYAAVIPLFIKQYIAHKQPVINGDGLHSRDFTFIDNVVQMNMLAIETQSPDALNRIYNTAASERTSVNDLSIMIRETLSNFDASIADIIPVHGSDRPGDIPHSYASIELARKYLGYSPCISFKEGLRKTVEWYWGISKNIL